MGATIRVYHKDRKSPLCGGCIGLTRLKVVEGESHFNIPLPESLFDTTIPTGKRVVDQVRNVVYTQGSDDPDAYLARLAAEGKKAVDRTPADRRFPPAMISIPARPRPWLSWRNAALALGAASLAFGASFLLRRLVRRTA